MAGNGKSASLRTPTYWPRSLPREEGAQTRVLCPIEGIPEEDAEAGGGYFTLMRQNLANLWEGMRCS